MLYLIRVGKINPKIRTNKYRAVNILYILKTAFIACLILCSNLLDRDRVSLTYGLNINPSSITHYLRFSVTVTSNLLWSKPYSDYQFFLHNKISELKEQGLGYRRISNILNEEGILTVRGKVFTNSHVHSILKKKNIREERLNRKSRKEVSKFVMEEVGLFD